MLIQKIPLLTDATDQILKITLDGNPYILRVLWNDRFEYFSLSMSEADETPILTNIKMVKNYPLTKRFKDTRLPFGSLYLIQEKGTSDRPAYSDLGGAYALYYYEADAAVTAQPVRGVSSAPAVGTMWDSELTTWDTGSTVWDH